MKKKLIEEMVNRFLGWKLPHDFAPDHYIIFDRESAQQLYDRTNGTSWPVGTNLFTADQARQMFEHCVEEKPEPLSEYWVLQTYKRLPLYDVEGIGENRFANIVRLVEEAHGIREPRK
jgi:hypothetical protein